MSDDAERRFIDCSVCGIEHVDYLLCGGAVSPDAQLSSLEGWIERLEKDNAALRAENERLLEAIAAKTLNRREEGEK